jgi:hypothetical protein
MIQSLYILYNDFVGDQYQGLKLGVYHPRFDIT